MRRAFELAKYIVDKTINEKREVNNFKLQELLFSVQKDFLGRDDKAFLDDMEAWPTGPVVPCVFYHYCGFGAMPITIKEPYDMSEFNPRDRRLIDAIIEEKMSIDSASLTREIHSADGAWALVYGNGAGLRRSISKNLIKAKG